MNEKIAVDLIVTGGDVMSMDGDNRILRPGAMAIRDGEILAVGTPKEIAARFVADRIIDARGKLAMPGLVDTYSHAGHGMIKAIYHPLRGWPSGHLYYHGTTEDFWYAEGLLSATERVRFGVTSNMTTVGGTPARTDSTVFALANARAQATVGLRGSVGVGPPDVFVKHIPEPYTATWWEEGKPETRGFTYRDTLEVSEEIFRRVDDLAGGGVGSFMALPYIFGRHPRGKRRNDPTPTYSDEDIPVLVEKAEEAVNLARRYGVRVQTHMFEGTIDFALEKMGRDEVMEILGPDVVVAHANGLREGEIDLLAEAGTRVASAPSMEENLWYGRCPVPEMLRAGVNVSITTDGPAPRISLDLFKDINRSLFLNWMAYGTQDVYPAGRALRMVTIDAARVMGIDHLVGSLEVGKRADIILLDMDRPHLTPSFHLPQLVAYYVNGNDVDTTIVDGKVLMEDRRVLTVDEGEVLDFAQEEAEKAVGRVDISPYLELPAGYWNSWRHEDAPPMG
ncbi:MAG: amidohydrolase family protein [Bacillota bacterium]